MGKREDVSNFDKGQIVIGRRPSQSVFKTAALVGCSQSAAVSKRSKEGKPVNRQQGYGRPRLIDARWELRLGRVIQSNRKAAVAQIAETVNAVSVRKSGFGWEMVTNVTGGPMSDHTNLTSGSGEQGEDAGYFMHVSTASGEEGDSAWLETHRMSLNREHHVQCLQFYYFHSGNMSDHLNIWIREFQDELDLKGTLRLMGQITGGPTKYWKLHHVSLNATKHFQVEFEVRKGAGSSTGGFSIDDIICQRSNVHM
ncbi:Meprin A subunit beta [Dissostichus eleginoides]|uniref:Meprin A subunit beta n=1 Tax=Dissostichus eleginoides TaxID=100907 RepID=A0AAD9CQJ1_DISEL|nr:Meprin A subunit beta [Dissostichus eleginoides]